MGVSGAAHTRASGALRRALARAAGNAPVRVFVIEGASPPNGLGELRLADRVQVVDSPRSATVLLVAGLLPEPLHEPARQIHDQVGHPRATVYWSHAMDASSTTAPFPDAIAVPSSADDAAGHGLLRVLEQTQRDLLAGRRASDPALLPDVDPAPWRGVGPYGQGGTGMTGGVPYGRPLAGRAPDRDGLELDQLPVRVGPFFPPFPTGLVLDLKLQGDVVQEASVSPNLFAGAARSASGAEPTVADRDRAASSAASAIRALELTRAQSHLRWLAHALRVHGLEALGWRVLGLARRVRRTADLLDPRVLSHVADDVATLGRLLERSGSLAWSTGGIGITAPELVAGRGLGPVARAAGLVDDVRGADDAYRALGFEPIIQPPTACGDARARWRQRLAEVRQSLDLAGRAGDRVAGLGAAESPRGRGSGDAAPFVTLLAMLPALLSGTEWGDAVMTIVSLDLELRGG